MRQKSVRVNVDGTLVGLFRDHDDVVKKGYYDVFPSSQSIA